MKLAKGPRPLAIWAFALLWTGMILESLLNALPPFREWENSESIVIGGFSIFTASLIPVLAVLIFASRIARALMTIMSAILLFTLLAQVWSAITLGHFDPYIAIHNLLMLIALGLLYLPASEEWLAQKFALPDPELDF